MAAGAAGGAWLAAQHYRPLLDTANSDLATARSARDNLLALTGEQNAALATMARDAKAREEVAALAAAKAREMAQGDYTAANRLLQERTGGDPAQAAASIIDQELGL
ncbi:hypothetical protein HX830_04550 [Pseudomonas gingeri]|uniref:Uncharacterized protein n=2 Tax=Pseudomonas gingeri TaxID=117681 RepID=A0A7Y7WN59_9PSED|nr:hypothetical protein [Pseudomonas gingeri]NWB84145.1 hypothetical protein [Pseudomonas gingeri]